MAALERYASSTRVRTTSWSGATSSWQSRKKAAPSTTSRTSFAAAPKPGLPSIRRTKAPGAERPTRAFTSLVEPASITRIDRFG